VTALWQRVEVFGESMTPTLHELDRLLVIGWPTRLLRPGHLVAVRRPDRVVVKRVAEVDHAARTLTVLGDNLAASSDSRDWGPVHRADVVGRAVYRYAPSERVGRLH
jgi:nickel-type superoxide dismutase maturation protease